MASIQKRPDGRWRARYRDDAGKEHARHFGRKVDAQGWLDEVTASVVTGTYVAPKAGNITFRAYAEEWRANQVYRPQTGELVELVLRKRIYPIIGDKPLKSFVPSDIQNLVKQLADKYAPRTVSVSYSYVATIFRAAVADRRIARTPCEGVDLPKIEPKKIQLITLERLDEIVAAMPPNLRAAVILAAGTGMRQGEVFGLTKDRIDWDKKVVNVDRQLLGRSGAQRFGPPKTDASMRTIPLPSTVEQVLALHCEVYDVGDDDLLFHGGRGAPLARSTFGDVWRRAAPGVDFHDLRHFYASLLIRNGESVKTVQANLGHKSAEETLNTYAHLWEDAHERTRDSVDRGLAAADFLRTAPVKLEHIA